MESNTRIDMITESSRMDTDSHTTEPSCWSMSTPFLGYSNQKCEESNACTQDLPVQRCQTRPDANASTASYGDDVYSKLSRINGAINKMTPEQIQKKLAEFDLNTSGVKEVLKKRLKNYYRRQRMVQCNKVLSEDERMKYDYLVIIDFEATCSETNENFMHEIIEFPAVMVDVRNQAVCNVFQRFCKPTVNPVLTDFCTTLTGISQSQVDRAKDFTEVFRDFEEWLSLHGLGTKYEFAVLTDGPWDMARFLKTQVELSSIEYPWWAKHWINLRKAYAAFYACGRVNLHKMLDDLGLKFQGRPHCGLDDSRNIAAIVMRLLQDGCIFRANEHYREGDINPNNGNASRVPMDSNTNASLARSHVAHSSGHKGHDCKVEG
uniref:SAP domain-containing protein n=1 Tax=Arion vulgaris TaxID=1028688 RepID=A0A0B7ATB0_9EUPU